MVVMGEKQYHDRIPSILTVHTRPATSCFEKPLDFQARRLEFGFGSCRGSLSGRIPLYRAPISTQPNQTPVMQEARIVASHVDHPVSE